MNGKPRSKMRALELVAALSVTAALAACSNGGATKPGDSSATPDVGAPAGTEAGPYLSPISDAGGG